MNKIDLSRYGITGATEVIYNPDYDTLYKAELDPSLTGYDKGRLTELGAVNVMTGVYTGRSPKDKFFVMDDVSKDTVWWTSDEYKNDNKPVTQDTWKALRELAVKELSDKRLYVVDAFCGANPATRLKVRFIMEVAWQAHFVRNMFIRPTDEELAAYGEPDFVVFNASKAKVENYKELGLNSETAVVFNLTSKEQVIINTWYGGEMKKGIFSIMNYYNPLRGIASMHCSANTDLNGERGCRRENRFRGQERYRKHPRFISDLPYQEHSKAGIERASRKAGHFPFGRCIRSASSGFDTYSGTDTVLLPVRLYRKTGRHRARNHRTYPDLLRMLRSGVPLTPPYQIR